MVSLWWGDLLVDVDIPDPTAVAAPLKSPRGLEVWGQGRATCARRIRPGRAWAWAGRGAPGGWAGRVSVHENAPGCWDLPNMADQYFPLAMWASWVYPRPGPLVSFHGSHVSGCQLQEHQSAVCQSCWDVSQPGLKECQPPKKDHVSLIMCFGGPSTTL